MFQLKLMSDGPRDMERYWEWEETILIDQKQIIVLQITRVVSFIYDEVYGSLGSFGIEIAVSFISVSYRETEEDAFWLRGVSSLPRWMPGFLQ